MDIMRRIHDMLWEYESIWMPEDYFFNLDEPITDDEDDEYEDIE